MARKIQYRAVSIEQVSPETLAGALTGAQKLVVAIDVAKTKMMVGFGREDGAVVRLVKWTHPLETRVFVEIVMRTARLLDVSAEALMEPTGTYGEPLRALLLANGVHVFMLSPKRVHDAAEVFDGVPSMHERIVDMKPDSCPACSGGRGYVSPVLRSSRGLPLCAAPAERGA